MDGLDHRRGLDDHPFDAEVGVLLNLLQHQGDFFRRDFGVQGHPNLALVVGGDAHRLSDVAVFQLPLTFPAAEALGPDIHGVGAVLKDSLHHFQAAAWGQQFVNHVSPTPP